MANIRKKISELTALTSASLDTTIVGVDNGITYKIELDTLADAVTSRVNILDRSRLSSLETYTSSFSASSAVGTISSSAQITALGFISSSQTINTGSLITTSSFNSFSASVHSEILAATNEQSFNGLISGSSQLTSSYDERYVISGSITQTTWDNISGKPSGLVSQSTDLTPLNNFTASISTASLVNRLNVIESVSGSWITESETGSFLTNLSGAISSSSQVVGILTSLNTFTSSANVRLNNLESTSASLNAYTSSNDSWKDGVTNDISSINSALSSLNNTYATDVEVAAGYEAKGRDIVSGSSQLTSSFDIRYALSASYLTSLNGTISSSIQILGGSGIYSSSAQLPSGLISGSSQLTSSFDTRYAASGSGGSLPSGVISGSSQITGIVNLTNLSATSQVSASVFVGGFGVPEAKFTVISNKAMTFWPNISTEAVRFTTNGGVLIGHNGGTNDFGNKLDVSGSIRIWGTTTLTGSVMVVNGLTGSIAATNGIVSGSPQILNYNILATTGSNSFNGNQTITGSLNVSSIAVVSSSFTANSSSLTLNSGSNLYIQNNGIVEITGSLLVSGSNNINLVSPVLQIGTGSGDEGGELLLAKAVTNTTLSGTGVTVDVYRDRIRIFEQGGAARGVYIDLAKTPSGVAGELLWKASGIVDAGTFVTLDNIKAQVPTSGNRGLSLATVSGTVTGYISGHYQGISSSSAGTSSTTSLSTTATTSMFNWNFGQQGDMSNYILRDDTNSRVYRIILIIGGGYSNNFISIERLY